MATVSSAALGVGSTASMATGTGSTTAIGYRTAGLGPYGTGT